MKTVTIFLCSLLGIFAIAEDTQKQEMKIESNGSSYIVRSYGSEVEYLPEGMCTRVVLFNGAGKKELDHITISDSENPLAAEIKTAHLFPGKDQQLVVFTYSGGNDMVSSCGALVYTINNGKLIEQMALISGDPTLEDINGDGIQEIVTSGEYWGNFLYHAICLPYLDTVYAYNGKELSDMTDSYYQYMQFEDTALNEYEECIQGMDKLSSEEIDYGDEEHTMAFRAAVAVLLAYRNVGKRAEAQAWWDSQSARLSRIMDTEHYAEILIELEPAKGRMWNGAHSTIPDNY